MRKKWLYLFSFCTAFFSLNTSLSANTIDTLVVFIDGQQAPVVMIEKGGVDLYSTSRQEEIVTEIHGGVYTTKVHNVVHYFLGSQFSIEEITPANYKRLIIKYLPNAPYLHRKLGKLGFRYENVSQMVQFYNKFRADEQPNQLVTNE